MIDLQKKMHFRFIKKDKGYGEYYMESSRKRKEDDPIALLRRKKRKRRMIRELTGRIIFLVNVILFIVLLVMDEKNSSNSRKMKEQNSLGLGSLLDNLYLLSLATRQEVKIRLIKGYKYYI